MEQEEQARKARSQRAAAARREELAASEGEDPVQAALARLKAKKAGEAPDTLGNAKGTPHIKTILTEKGETVPDNSEIFGISGLIGAGRTELLRLIYGADLPDSGTVALGGRDRWW